MNLIRAHYARGQSTVELAISVTILAMLVMCLVDIGIHVSSATRLPEAIRAGALLLTSANNTLGVNVRPIKGFQEIIRCAANQASLDLHKDAQITVSYVQRVGSVCRITRQYTKAPGSSASIEGVAVHASRFGALNADVSTKIPPSTFVSDSDWVVVVEVFYEPRYITPMAKLLKWSTNKALVYEIAVF